jgi:hypothetical protein
MPKYIKIIILVLVVATVSSTVTALNFYTKLKAFQNPAAASEAETKKIVADVSKVIVLPGDETPTLATVSEPEKLKDQPFFANALAGDKVLVYTKAQKAILWRPSSAKVIEVSGLNIAPSANN